MKIGSCWKHPTNGKVGVVMETQGDKVRLCWDGHKRTWVKKSTVEDRYQPLSMVAFTSWEPRGETFRFLAYSFDVDRAKELLAERPRVSDTLEVEECRAFVNRIVIDKGAVDDADLTVPVIFWQGEDGKTFLPIDGWHRIAKALKEEVKSLPAVLLTKKESKEVLL